MWRGTFPVRSFEVDVEERARPAAVTSWLQEAAVRDAIALGVARRDLPAGTTWMLNRLLLVMDGWPRFGDEVVVETWPRGRERLHALRDFVVETTDGAPLGRGTSAWLVVDLARRRPVRLPASLEAVPAPPRGPVLPDGFGELPPVGPDAGAARRFEVRWSECDLNRHANQAAYVRWAVDTLPEDVLETSRPAAIAIEFRGEARLGETVDSRWRRGADGAIVHGIAAADGRELARLTTRWVGA